MNPSMVFVVDASLFLQIYVKPVIFPHAQFCGSRNASDDNKNTQQ